MSGFNEALSAVSLQFKQHTSTYKKANAWVFFPSTEAVDAWFEENQTDVISKVDGGWKIQTDEMRLGNDFPLNMGCAQTFLNVFVSDPETPFYGEVRTEE